MYSPHHVAISVSDRNKAIMFYAQLDFKEVQTWNSEDGSLTITHLKNESANFILELFCYTNFAQAPNTIFETSTDLPILGTKHLGLRVNSIEQAKQDLINKKIAPPGIEITQGRTGPRYFFIKDPDGILVEILEDNRKFMA